MPTNDYNSSAVIYKALFDALNRTPAVALVPENEEYNRDELFHFIEDKFKTNIKGGITAENLRAILHTIVKSSIIKKDDERQGLLISKSLLISSGAADRWYMGSFSYGWDYHSWTQYITNATLDGSNIPNISGSFAHMGVDVPFPLYNFTIKGSVSNTVGTGIVDMAFFYSDNDDSSNTFLQNVTYLTSIQVDCTVVQTAVAFSGAVGSSVVIPEGKKIWAFIRNTGYDANEKLRMNLQYQYTNKVSTSASFATTR
jgi:hypothetical protein